MTDQTPSKKRTWIAIWRWPRWKLGIFLLPVLVAYAFCPPILMQVWVRTGCNMSVETCMRYFLQPQYAVMNVSPALARIYQWESNAIDAVIGRAPLEIRWADGSAYILAHKEERDRLRKLRAAPEDAMKPENQSR